MTDIELKSSVLELLKDIEWVDLACARPDHCPSCGGSRDQDYSWQPKGHDEDCLLKKILRGLEGGK